MQLSLGVTSRVIEAEIYVYRRLENCAKAVELSSKIVLCERKMYMPILGILGTFLGAESGINSKNITFDRLNTGVKGYKRLRKTTKH